ncbi:Protein of unknown function [Singulisphaera sp. GP187]|uniref:DUF1559 family PulG-like putative transporter n=1 Tax=Singulisphaera sp. GP187 TaxID=1882752 RepID=UPI00092B9165|nr:DUF1559 domain-containing protein [Singulisphaera sp. GP187]SIO58154.1 Protein of unknown function [Singulisphaera sp. GP187]
MKSIIGCIKMHLRLWAGVVALLTASPFLEAAAAAPLAHYFPKEDLAVYAEFDGLDTHGELWRKTAAYRLLSGTPTGAMLETVLVQLAGRLRPNTTGTTPEVGELRILAEHLIRHGFAVAIVRNPGQPRPVWVGLVFRGGAKGQVRAVVEKFIASTGNPDAKPQSVAKPKGRTLSIEGGTEPRVAWWQEGDDLALSLLSPAGADVMIEALDGGRPDATAHPDRVALARVVDGFTPVGLAFADLSAFAPLPPQAAAFGLDRVKRLEYRWGIQGDALMTVTRLVAPAPRSGLLALFDQPTFGPESLAALPPGLAGVTAFSVDLGGVYDRFVAGLNATNPAGRQTLESTEIAFRTVTGLRIRDDLLAQLGSKVTYFSLPTRGDAPSQVVAGLAQGVLRTPRFSAILEVKDQAAFAKLLDGAVSKTEGYFRDQFEANKKPPPVRVHPLKGVAHGYSVSISPSVAPLPAGFRPTFILRKSSLIFASNPEDARATLELQERVAPLPASDPLALSLNRLPRRAIMASVIDERRSLLPELIANVPLLVQWGQAFVGPRFMRPQFRQVQPGRPGILMPLQQSFVAGLEIDPDTIPTPEEVRPFLFPSVFTLTADDQAVEYTTREAFPVFNPVVLAPVAVAILLPATQSARVAAQRSQSVNNLKQIALALHNFHAANNTFPPQATYGKNKKPLLSWRVAILPYLEQAALYNEFKHDEPWDSPHNKALIPRMPKVYLIPGAKVEPGKTYYRGFSGPSTLFDDKQKEGVGVGLANITDGTSVTLGIVEAKDAVVWTKPDEEIPFAMNLDPANVKKLQGMLGGHFPGGFNACFLDGSVRFIQQTINTVVLRALITRNGGEVIGSDAF